MVLSRALAFLRRHRRKFLFLSLAAAGGCVCVHYLLRKLKQMSEEKVSDVLAQVRKECHFESNEKTYWTTVAGMVPALRAAVVSELNCEALAAVLKTKPENKAQLWSQLKCMALTRLVATVYSTCLMATALRVQLSLLGGYLFVDGLRRVSSIAEGDCLTPLGLSASSGHGSTTATSAADVSLSSAVQQSYLESLHHLLRDGLCNLIQIVTDAVHGHVSSLQLNQPLTYTDVRKILDRVRAAVEGDDGRLGHRAHRLITFLLPAEEADEGAVALTADEIALKRIMNETRDIVESADYHMVLGASLDRGFALLLDGIGSIYRKQAADVAAAAAAGATAAAAVSDCYSTVNVPLAKIVSQGAGLSLSMLADGPESFAQKVVQLDCVRVFGHNVYEAFCQANAA